MHLLYDAVRLAIVALFAPLAFGPGLALALAAHARFGAWSLAFTAPFGAYVGIFLFLALVAAVGRLVVGELPAGEALPGSKAYGRWGLHTLFHSYACGELRPFLSTYLGFQRLYYGLWGMRIGSGTMIAQHVLITEPGLVSLGRDVVVGSAAMLATHIGGQAGSMRLGTITVEDRAVVGANTMIAFGTVIGAGATIGAGAVLGPGAKVGASAKVGLRAILEPGSSLGDGAELAWGAVLPKGTHVPAGERYGFGNA